MPWSKSQIQEYRKQGFLFVPEILSEEEIADLNASVPDLLDGTDDGMHRERERSGAVRQVYLAHRYSSAFQTLVRNPRILSPVKRILENEVYVYQSKPNA